MSILSAGLVLTGGGARAAYQVGALQALAEVLPAEAIPFRTLAGTSAGAINAAFLASRATHWPSAVRELGTLWSQLELNQVYRTDSISLSGIALDWISRTVFGGKAGTGKRANHLLNTQPLRELLSREIDFAAIKRNFGSGVLQGLSFSTVSYVAGTTVSFFDGVSELNPWLRSNRIGVRAELNVDHIMASTAIPIFFPPVEIDSQFYGDGCLRQTTPLSPAIHLGADRILAICIEHERNRSEIKTALASSPCQAPTLAEITGELMNSLFLDSLGSDAERVSRINESLSRMSTVGNSKKAVELRPIPVLLLRPSRDLGQVVPPLLRGFPRGIRYLFKGLGVSDQQGNAMISYLAFLKECIQPLMQLGYEDTFAQKNAIVDFMS